MNPRVIREEGFKHLDRVVEALRRQRIYTSSICTPCPAPEPALA